MGLVHFNRIQSSNMYKSIGLLLLCFLSLICKSQIPKDTCLSLPDSIKAYIPATDSNQIKLSDIINGFSLYATNSKFKINSFRVGYFDESDGNVLHECNYEGNQFIIKKYDQLELHINGAKRLFIDCIKTIKDNRCYYFRAMILKVIK